MNKESKILYFSNATKEIPKNPCNDAYFHDIETDYWYFYRAKEKIWKTVLDKTTKI